MNDEQKQLLEKMIKDKEDNLYLYRIDILNFKRENPTLEDDMKKCRDGLDAERAKGAKLKNKETIIALQDKLRVLVAKKNELKDMIYRYKAAKKLIKLTRECIKNPELISEDNLELDEKEN